MHLMWLIAWCLINSVRFGSKAMECFHLDNNLPKECKSVYDAIVASQLHMLPKVLRKEIAAPSAKSIVFEANHMAMPFQCTYIHLPERAISGMYESMEMSCLSSVSNCAPIWILVSISTLHCMQAS